MPDSNYNFHSFKSSNLGPLHTLDNAQGNSSFDVLSLGIWGSAATVKSHQYFPSQTLTSAEEKPGKLEWHEGYTGNWALCLLCFSCTSNTTYKRQLTLVKCFQSYRLSTSLVQWDKVFRQKGCTVVGYIKIRVCWERNGRALADEHRYGNSRVNSASVLRDTAVPAELCKLINSANFDSVKYHLDWLGSGFAWEMMSGNDPHPVLDIHLADLSFSCKWKGTWARISIESERNMHRSSQWYPRISRFWESSDNYI